MATISITAGDATLLATVTGSGPTVLLLHAGGERRSVWAPVAERLSMRTVAYDLRGHGESSGRATSLAQIAEDVAEMVVREPPPIVVVGTSLGGLAALAALAEPATAQRVAGLVLVDVVPDPDPDRARAWLAEQGLGRRRAELVDDILGSGYGLAAVAAALEVPMMLVRAGRSALADAEVDRFRSANHRVTVVEVPAAGHLVARDAPAELALIVEGCAAAWLRPPRSASAPAATSTSGRREAGEMP
ncbi:alpha/beta fold hydrolase [Pseudonocardia sp. TRM90224]|uniref:alpha/beta fold hydrolase n=1 Tax=Pseudonocardia sp. TRM90224 TaxID=2812678 RepID=UPI001E4A57F2|nr:alpha/beta hydrolase family protein [Pseudonocardia sp. TRM90224]